MDTTKVRCLTEKKMEATSKSNFSRLSIIEKSKLDQLSAFISNYSKIRLGVLTQSGEAIIPLWGLVGESKQLLTWEFHNDSIEDYFLNPNNSKELFANGNELKEYIRNLIFEAMQLWGDSSPFILQEADGITDFTVKVKRKDDCTEEGCVLASAFFPSDIEDKELSLYPILFKQTRNEQVETIIHELGHIKGLRHSFAQDEIDWPNGLFGHDNQLSIMNYGVNSQLTDIDKEDLKKLYQAVWSGGLKEINKMPIKLYYTEHTKQSG
jgi:predicted Zn-dependent protease